MRPASPHFLWNIDIYHVHIPNQAQYIKNFLINDKTYIHGMFGWFSHSKSLSMYMIIDFSYATTSKKYVTSIHPTSIDYGHAWMAPPCIQWYAWYFLLLSIWIYHSSGCVKIQTLLQAWISHDTFDSQSLLPLFHIDNPS